MHDKKLKPLDDATLPVAFHLGDILAAMFNIDCSPVDPSMVTREGDVDGSYMSGHRWPNPKHNESSDVTFSQEGRLNLTEHMSNIRKPPPSTMEDIRDELKRQHRFLTEIKMPHGFSNWYDTEKLDWLQQQVNKYGTWHKVTPIAELKKQNRPTDQQNFKRTWFPNLQREEIGNVASQYHEIEQAIIALSKLGDKEARIGANMIQYTHEDNDILIAIKTTDPEVHNARLSLLEKAFKEAGLASYIYPGFVEHEDERPIEYVTKIRARALLDHKQDLQRLRDYTFKAVDTQPVESWARGYQLNRPLDNRISPKEFAELKKLKYTAMAESLVLLTRLSSDPAVRIAPHDIREETNGPETEHRLVIPCKGFDEAKTRFEYLDSHFHNLGWRNHISYDCHTTKRDDGTSEESHLVTIDVGRIIAKEQTSDEPAERPAMRSISAYTRKLSKEIEASRKDR